MTGSAADLATVKTDLATVETDLVTVKTDVAVLKKEVRLIWGALSLLVVTLAAIFIRPLHRLGGGRAYTRDLACGLKTSHAAAEHAKRRYGVALLEKVPEDDYCEVQASGGGYPNP